MMGSRVSLLVGLVASAIILLIGSLYGSISGFFGGWVDMVMMRIVDIMYTVPDVLIIILLAAVLNYPLKDLSQKPGFEWIGVIGVNLIQYFSGIRPSLLGWYGPYRAKPDHDFERAGVCDGGQGSRRFQRQDYQENIC